MANEPQTKAPVTAAVTRHKSTQSCRRTTSFSQTTSAPAAGAHPYTVAGAPSTAAAPRPYTADGLGAMTMRYCGSTASIRYCGSNGARR